MTSATIRTYVGYGYLVSRDMRVTYLVGRLVPRELPRIPTSTSDIAPPAGGAPEGK